MTMIINGVDVLDTVKIQQIGSRSFVVSSTDTTPKDLFGNRPQHVETALRCWCFGNCSKTYTIGIRGGRLCLSFRSSHDAAFFKLQFG